MSHLDYNAFTHPSLRQQQPQNDLPSPSSPNAPAPYTDNPTSPIEGPSADDHLFSSAPPPPPPHRDPLAGPAHGDSLNPGRPYAHDPNNYSDYSPPASIGMDNTSDGASATTRGSFLQQHSAAPLGIPQAHERTPFSDQYAYDSPTPPRAIHSQHSAVSSPSLAPQGTWSSNSSQRSMPLNAGAYSDSPYNRYSSSNLNLAPQMGMINPNELADDDDWGISPAPNQQAKRRSFVPFGSGSRDGTPNSSSAGVAGAAGAAAAAGGALAAGAGASGPGSGAYDAVPTRDFREKDDWREGDNTSGRKKNMWIIIGVIAVVVIGAIVGSVLGTQLTRGGIGKANDSTDNTKEAASAVQKDNQEDLGLDSDEIKQLMNNKNLHKVFPGMDYTPLNTQYPDCSKVPPSQNNITRDMAVMSQLTNAVRLYGTDCNQTAMVLHAMDRLELTDMQLWVGVWLDQDAPTNKRQMEQFYDTVDEEIKHKNNLDRFKGVIVGNEVLFREDLSKSDLLEHISWVKGNLTKRGHSLPVATSDLGDNWTAEMATEVDIVMSNVHPFFAGVDVGNAAGWTYEFWTTHDVALTASDKKIKQIVAEVGWPTGGGNGCGDRNCTTDTEGSVAGIDELNQFMEDWVCPSMKNQTEYFWFSAFDEPWKIRYNEEGKEWEDKWGLMDVNRNLKKGVKIPDCGGDTV
ncbi:unnamed protein product [Periconia digitata]|uniref:glucan endo-1,3-beta-D-glucosidase n=1 Tax=Periconia digitata TaxID=1303443 RepID=A0A9W4URY5_9PLEO|nr:unnamed protein product [Periconia digitata]